MQKKKTSTSAPAAVSTPAAPSLPPLSALVGNPRLRRLLARAVEEDRLFPALLLHGPDGVGKLTTALALGAAMNCDRPAGGDACGTCPPCRRVAGFTHPDVKVCESAASAHRAGRPLFFPSTRGAGDGDATEEKGTGGGRAGARLLIAQVRNLLRELAFRPFEGRRRLIAIDGLETDPTGACANVLLKTLEEPPPGTVLVLISTRPDSLPETVRSRCQALAFGPTPRSELVPFLLSRGYSEEQALLRAELADGRPGAALSLDLEEKRARRDAVLAALAEAARAVPIAALETAERLGRDRDGFAETLDHLCRLARDLMVLPNRPDGGMLLNADRAESLIELSRAVPPAAAARVLDLAAWCERALERNVDPGLMLANLLLEAGGHLPADPLAVPWLEPAARSSE